MNNNFGVRIRKKQQLLRSISKKKGLCSMSPCQKKVQKEYAKVSNTDQFQKLCILVSKILFFDTWH